MQFILHFSFLFKKSSLIASLQAVLRKVRLVLLVNTIFLVKFTKINPKLSKIHKNSTKICGNC